MAKPLNRRTLLQGAAAALAVVGLDPHTGRWMATADAHTVAVPALDGQLLFDTTSRQAVATDFGRVVSRVPVAVLKPGSVSDIVKMVRFCRWFRLPIGARGQAHTMYGQSQVAGGVVIDMGTLNRIDSIEPGVARVQGGVVWRDLLAASVALGQTPPVLTDYIRLSVGGTLSVGGVNGTSYWQGAQVDNVLALEVVTGEGEHLHCSPTQRRSLFEAVLGGLGQCAIIVGATLRLVPAPLMARDFQMVYPTLEALMADFRVLLADGRFSYVEALMPALPSGGFVHVLQGVKFYSGTPPDNTALLAGLNFIPGTFTPTDLSYFAFCDRLEGLVAGLQASGRWALPHPWLDMFVPDEAANGFIAGVQAQLSAVDLPDLPLIVYGFKRQALGRPLFRTPASDTFFLVDILRTTDLPSVPHAVAQNRAFYNLAAAQGGRFYPISAVPMTRADWRRHFQPEWGRLVSAKQRFDPAGILTPGPGIF
jgi:cytokinin dehydrogenase